jgi:TRAP transporter TAXI family solute receptor
MQKKRMMLVFGIILTLFMMISVCVGKENKFPKFLTIGSAASGGAYYPIAIVMADIITNKLGIQTTAQVTGGATENNGLIQNKRVDLAISTGALSYTAYNGLPPYTQKHKDINVLFNNLSTGLQQVVVLKNSKIKSMGDLKGKKVCMGPAGGAGINVANDVWSIYKFGVADVKATYLSYSDGMDALVDGNIDAVVVQSAAPASAITQLAASGKSFRIISVEPDKAKKIHKKFPYYSAVKLSKSVYGVSEDEQVISGSNMVIVNRTFPRKLAYEITKVLFENIEKIRKSNPTARDMSLETADKNLPIPMHPGAAKYFRGRKVAK